ncbi:hypothetical protein U0035_01920 [Niabella yanshanensis]|uniref:Uncharacterized protein n=1 Tax=Niabella yanshanensis TaxID=577386 RepID=A0ABZ0W6K0_9BACT|nr:hypothetical protein [Niabella yanshanensis]WQD38900.1 hypothetical protein U0035_01920 [Niabella yanshanensis]
MTLFSFLYSCDSSHSSPAANDTIELEEITTRINPADGWNDVFLKIVKDQKTDSSHIYTVKGLYKEQVVGLQIEVNSSIGAGIVDGKPNVNSGTARQSVHIRSMGAESDAFVKALAEIYGRHTVNAFRLQPLSVTAFSLNETPVNLDKSGYYKLKLFLEEYDEDLYSEVFLNINTEKKEIEINEKDWEYRRPIIEFLSDFGKT